MDSMASTNSQNSSILHVLLFGLVLSFRSPSVKPRIEFYDLVSFLCEHFSSFLTSFSASAINGDCMLSWQ